MIILPGSDLGIKQHLWLCKVAERSLHKDLETMCVVKHSDCADEEVFTTFEAILLSGM